MAKTKWLTAIPLVVFLAGSTCWGSTIRDEAKMFSPRAVEDAQARLDRLERKTNIPVVIETIEHVRGLDAETPRPERLRAINELAKRRDEQIHDEGIYILIAKNDHLISQPLIRERLEDTLPREKRDAIRVAFTDKFKTSFDAGLENGIRAIEKALDGVRVEGRRGGARAGLPGPAGAGGARGHAGGGGGSVLWTFLLIGGGILAVLILLRVLGGLFGRSAGGGYPNQMGAMGGPGPGMGPGGPGYYGGGGGYGGGRGGGFFSGVPGGLGGALAGNWLYDQMSGRHGGTSSAGAGYPVDDPSASAPDRGGDEIVGADDHGGQGGSWDDGGNAGGGDWGGGDAGGDWGGGDAGGDWGGGGGDGGGDW